jgi:GDP-4-dehydro-6-deoxy-D-mannose reductase
VPDHSAADESRAVVVTGINGFVGQHVAADLHGHGFTVFGIGRDDVVDPAIKPIVTQYISADLSEGWPMLPEVDAVVHLAGLAAVGASFEDPQQYISVNSAIITHLCEHYLESTHQPRILGISSGAIYASAGKHGLVENSPIRISSPYVVSKLLIENQLSYYSNRGLDCVTARPFNHVGPGQGAGFLIADLVKQVSDAMKTGMTVSVGDLTTARDYTDVRDVATAYRLLATAPELAHRLYNVASGHATSGEKILRMVRAALGAEKLDVTVDAARLRPNDNMFVVGDARRLHRDLGWSPAIPLMQTIADVAARM